uniref:Choline O-acetyltransferase n=1 Tax=Plectus sambesii TaxID=2011161 RepID=A0A914UUR4_9BILA
MGAVNKEALSIGNAKGDWYEAPLPKPPVPDLQSTLSKYLDYAKVIAIAKRVPIANTERAVQKFASQGSSIQRRLEQIAENEPNWINCFWLPEMYLSVRLALPVNTNPAYIFPQQAFKTRKDQIECKVKREKFDVAVERQAAVTRENITGHGIDNHLCALSTLAREAVADGKIDQPPELFTDPLFDELMRFPLSTSQVTTTVADTFLCYGPVVPDGYGSAYNLQNDHIIFAVSAFKRCAKTSAYAFKEAIRQSLIDMRELLAESS